MKKLYIITAIIFIFLTLTGGFLWGFILNKPFKGQGFEYLYIDRDDNVDSVYHKLMIIQTEKAIAGFQFLNLVWNYSDRIKPGAYRIKEGETSLDIFRKLRNGSQNTVTLTIPSTWTVERVAKSVGKQLMCDSAEIAELMNDSVFCRSLGFTAETLPALFIPDSYDFIWTTSPEAFFRRMRKEYEAFWTADRKERAMRKGLNIIEVATLASVVQSETANNAEKPMVAGLYLNRLRVGMPLQADPTVKFGLRQFGLKRILLEHIRIDTPYNTYLHKGLPPGPICIATPASIESVLNAIDHNYLYMCAKEDFSGTHNFAANYAEHLANARKYQQALNQRGIK